MGSLRRIYDRRGNLASASKDGVFQKSFRFDAANRMASAVTATGDTAAYTYDGLGRRIKSVWDTAAATGREAQHEEKRYILDALKPYDNILMAYGADGAARHVWGNELISASNNGPGADGFDKSGFGGTDPVYYLNNELRTPVRVTDAAGGSLSHFGYDEFGVPLPQEPGGSGSGAGSGAEPFGAKSNAGPFSTNLFGFTGYQPDPVSGLCYAQARYYMPQAGRFVSEDTHWNTLNMVYGDNPGNIVPNNEAIMQSANLYGYCMQNPTRYIDLTGNTAQDANEYAKNNPKPQLPYGPLLPNAVPDYRTELDKWWDGYCDAYNLNNTGPKMKNYSGKETEALIEEAKRQLDESIAFSGGSSAYYIPQVSSFISGLISKALPFAPAIAPNPVTVGLAIAYKIIRIVGAYSAVDYLEKWNADRSGVVALQDEVGGVTLPIWLWDFVDLKELSFQGDTCPVE